MCNKYTKIKYLHFEHFFFFSPKIHSINYVEFTLQFTVS